MDFTHLHVHSEYSLLDGLIKLDNLVAKTRSLGMDSVALTDHGAMYGSFYFYIKAREAGIKPIIGMEAYKAQNSRHDRQKGVGTDQHHLTLLARNNKGYKNLMKLTTQAHLDGFYYKPRVDFELLEKHNEGIIALTGCLNGEVPSLIREGRLKQAEETLRKYIDVFGENLYIEIQKIPRLRDLPAVNKQLQKFSRKYSIPIVATNDVHYLEKEQAYAQEILLCIQTQHTIHEKDRPLSMIDVPEFYLKSPQEMKGLFVDMPEAIDNTTKIKEMCNVEIEYGKWILPHFPLPKGKTSESLLRELTKKAASKRLAPSKEVQKRLAYELDVITSRGYSTYFLIVQDFVNWAKERDVAVGPGRGSVAGSLAAYALNITDINPLEYNLPFERFLNPDRPTPPDIDIDFADIRRDEVLDYVTNQYGKDKVAQIITFGRMEARLAVRDVTRALGLSYSHGDRIAKMIPQGKQGFSMSIDKALQESSPLQFAYDQEEDTKRVLDLARQVEGIARHSSVHAAGVVISDKPLTEYVPLQCETKGDKIITQYDMYALDLNAVSNNKAIGLLKVDFLGLRNLTIIEQAVKFVKQTYDVDIDIHNIPIDDKKTYKLLSSGKTIGVFQLESRGMRRLARDLKPSKFSDISAMVALFRPGPMDLIPSFLEGKAHQKKIKYLHPDLKPILAETYGVLVYQEQVMDIAHQIAGYSMSEADSLRMAMGKKKKSLMSAEKSTFIQRCIKSGYTKTLAEKIFSFIEKFVGYGFNKPHSASYALIAYWTAYLKANYPVEYMTALLTAELQGAAGSQREAKVFQTIEEARSMKIDVLAPHIDKSDFDFKTEFGAIRFGLSAVKNVGKAAIESILEERAKGKFTSFKDFLQRVDLRRVNKKTVESLIKVGAFDEFGSRAAILTYYPEVHEEVVRFKKQKDQGQYGLFDSSDNSKSSKDILPEIDEFDENQLLAFEKEVLGFALSKNPLKQYSKIFSRKVTKKIGELSTEDVGKNHILGGNVSSVKRIRTKKTNSSMAFVSMFDETGSIEIVVFPKLFSNTGSIWSENTPILLKGRIDEKQGDLTVIADRAVDLTKVS